MTHPPAPLFSVRWHHTFFVTSGGGVVTSSPCHSGDTEKSHQVVESHIMEEESPWHTACFIYNNTYIYIYIYPEVAEALRTAGKMTDAFLKRFICVKNPKGMIGKLLIPISSRQIEILLVQRPFGTACFIRTWRF